MDGPVDDCGRGPEKYRSRRWLLTLLVLLVATLLVLTDRLDGGAWVTVALAALGMYGAMDFGDRKLNAGH